MGKFLRVGLVGFLFIFMIMGLSIGAEKEYPTRPINVIVPAAPGGGGDMIVRTMTDYFQELLGQPLVPVNKTGAGGLVGGNVIVTANADGYTIGILWVPPSIPEVYRYFQEPAYTSADLKPICKLADLIAVAIAKSDAPWNSFKELLEHVRKNPGLKYSTTGTVGTPYLFMKMIESKEKVNFVHVTAIGDNEMISNILGGHIPFGHSSYSAARGHIQAGTIKVLATFAPSRFELLPETPTLAEQGYDPGQYPIFGFFGPKNLPDPIVQKISETVKKVCENPSFRKKVNTLGLQASFESSDRYGEILNQYKTVIGNIFKELGYVKK